MKIFSKSISILILICLGLLTCPSYIRTEDDVEDDDDVVIEEETQKESEPEKTELEEDTTLGSIGASPFVRVKVLFVNPETTEVPAGKQVKLLVGFHNNGTSSFFVEHIEGSFRYPQDFSYHIQNFTHFEYNKWVESDKEATFEYLFVPSETFSSRQFGFTVNLKYKDMEGKDFLNTVFNDTVSVVEPDEGIDGETFFLYIFLAALIVLLLVAGQQLLATFSKKKRSTKSYGLNGQKLANSSSMEGDIDFEWIPKEHLKTNKSPNVSPLKRRSERNGKGNITNGNSSNDE